MKHRNPSGQKAGNIRVSFDMLPKGVQKGSPYKQMEVMYRMLKKICGVSGLNKEIRDREFYVKPGERRRKARKLAKAVARGEIKDKTRELEDSKFEDYGNY